MLVFHGGTKSVRSSVSCLIVFVLFALPLAWALPQEASAGQATLSWDPPATNTDGTPLTDLAGYVVYYGTLSQNYQHSIEVGNVNTYTVASLNDGTYYFAVTAVDAFGVESDFSNEASKVIGSVQTYTLTLTKSGSGTGTVTSAPSGISCGSFCSKVFNRGTIITLTASPAAGSTFSGWSGGICSGTGTCSFSLNANTTVSATFATTTATTTYSISASAGTGGSITPSGSVAVNRGASQAFTITPGAGYKVADVKVDGASVGAVTSYTFSNVTAAHTISAAYAPVQYTITSNVTGGSGTISCTSPVNSGAAATCTISPAAGYRLATLTDNGVSVVSSVSGGTYRIASVTANHAVSAAFTSTQVSSASSLISNSVNGICGSANGGTFSTLSVSSSGLCSAGTVINFSGSGPWTWTCEGISGGSNSQPCSANKLVDNGTHRTLSVNSANPGGGLDFAYRLAGQTAWQGGITPFQSSFSSGTQLEIVFPYVAFSTGDNIFSSIDGCDSVSYWSSDPAISNSVVCLTTMNNHRSISVQYSGVIVGTPPATRDVFWQNGSTGAVASWTMDGATKTGESGLLSVPPVWEVAGAADFNGDGEADLLLSNQSSGSFYLYYMGSGVLGGQAAGGVPDTNWKIAGLADFNSDGSPDYLWYHEGKGYTYIWLMGFDDWHGLFVKGGAELNRNGFAPGANWRIKGTGDFNGDGKPDMLWQDQGSGDISVWLMNGMTASSSQMIPWQGADRSWKVAGAGDFNKDGKADILLRHPTTGQNMVWFMNGAAVAGTALLDGVADTEWKIVGVK